MGVQLRNGQSRSFGELLRELAEGSSSLVRQEARLARLELSVSLRGVTRSVALVVLGSVLLLLGALALLTGLILLGGDQWLRDRYWLAALVVFVLAGAIALVFASRGKALLSPRQLAPDQTVATLEENTEWLKRQLKSGATSS
jgi:uncharacterized membrane protein YqjE